MNKNTYDGFKLGPYSLFLSSKFDDILSFPLPKYGDYEGENYVIFSLLDLPMLFELDLSAVFPLYKFLFLHLFPGNKAE